MGTLPSSWTKRSANNRIVQRSEPAGAGPQSKAIRCASCAPSIFRGGGAGRGRPHSATLTPSATNACRTRPIVSSLTPYASRICSSVQRGPPGLASAFSNTQAWRSVRAAVRPVVVSFSSSRRSSWVNVTIYFFLPVGVSA